MFQINTFQSYSSNKNERKELHKRVPVIFVNGYRLHEILKVSVIVITVSIVSLLHLRVT